MSGSESEQERAALDGRSTNAGGHGPADELAEIEREYRIRGDAPRRTTWLTAIESLEPLLAAARDVTGARTLADALDADLAGLADSLGLRRAFLSITLSALAGERHAADDMLSALTPLADRMPKAELLIATRRTFATERQTLQQLGDQLGVTRERVRQIEARLTRSVDRRVGPQLRVLVDLAKHELGPVTSTQEIDRLTEQLFSHAPTHHAQLGVAMLRSGMGYSCEDGICLDEDARAVVDRLQEASTSLADDVGLVNEDALKAAVGEDWVDYWPELIRRCGFSRLSGQLALRRTQKAAVKAALIAIGELATRDQIAARAGVTPSAAGSQLSGIPSAVKADKSHWALTEWIEEEYGGIAGEIIQRIEADGGATSLQRLLVELPQRFGVSEASVRAFAANAPQFDLSDGLVRLADESTIVLRELDEVIDGRDETGSPYWTFVVHERYMRGYSLVGVPPEFAGEFGCGPNGQAAVRVLHPSGCRDLSVIWRLTSLVGASIGYLAEPLAALGAAPGDRVRIVARGHDAAELRLEDTRPQAGEVLRD